MMLRIGERVFAPGAAASVATLVLLAILISLGFWQLRRADEKRTLMAQAEAGRHSTLVLNSTAVAQLKRYQHVQVHGRFDSAHQILLDNMPSKDGQPGYRVLTPLQLEAGGLVLVDRGWVPLGNDRKTLPQLAVGQDPRTLSGMLDELPRPGVRAGGAGVVPDVWPQVLNYPRYTELRLLYGPQLQAHIVLMDADAADGFERVWQINLGFGPERHIGYAIQWFGLAVTLLIIYVLVNLKRSTHVAGAEVK